MAQPRDHMSRGRRATSCHLLHTNTDIGRQCLVSVAENNGFSPAAPTRDPYDDAQQPAVVVIDIPTEKLIGLQVRNQHGSDLTTHA